MTKDKILEVVGFYRDTLALKKIEEIVPQRGIDRLLGRKPETRSRPLGDPTRWIDQQDQDENDLFPGAESQLRHARWMTGYILAGLGDGTMSEGKAFRWLGFLQGVLWSRAIFTLEELKSHNRSDANA